MSRVSVPTPPTLTDEMRQAIWAQMQQEQQRPRGRRQRAAQQQRFVPGAQMPAAQPQQPAKQSGGVAAFIGCLIVLGFFVLVLVNILGAIFSG